MVKRQKPTKKLSDKELEEELQRKKDDLLEKYQREKEALETQFEAEIRERREREKKKK